MTAERHFGFEIENRIAKTKTPSSMISPTLEGIPYDTDHDVYWLDRIVLKSTRLQLICKTAYTFWGTFEIISPPFAGLMNIPPLLREGKDIIFSDIPQRYMPWREFIMTKRGPPMTFDFIPVSPEKCGLELYKFDVSIELSGIEARLIASRDLIQKFNSEFPIPSLSEVRSFNEVSVLHTAFEGVFVQEDLDILTIAHIHRVLAQLEG
jgi:hypothetical protein